MEPIWFTLSEMALLNLFDPRTGMPVAVLDATALTEMRTGAAHVDSGRLNKGNLHDELGEMVAGLKPGRESPGELRFA